MTYKVLIPPDLGLSPSEFIRAWNEDPDCRAVARGDLPVALTRQFDAGLVGGGLALLGTVAVGVSINLLSDYLKQVFRKQGERRKIKITALEQPDGTSLLRVEVIEH